jgi:HSP20 family protein
MKSLVPFQHKKQGLYQSFLNDDFLDRIWEKPFLGIMPKRTKSFSSASPSIEILKDKNMVIVRAEVPGMEQKDIEVTWHDGFLRIKGEKKSEKEEKKGSRIFSECSYGYFSRDIAIGDPIDWKNSKAHFKNGILNIKMPKTEKAQKVLEIKVK